MTNPVKPGLWVDSGNLNVTGWGGFPMHKDLIQGTKWEVAVSCGKKARGRLQGWDKHKGEDGSG